MFSKFLTSSCEFLWSFGELLRVLASFWLVLGEVLASFSVFLPNFGEFSRVLGEF